MGCDIHVYIEYKLGDGPWTLDSGHKVEREDDNYKRLISVYASRRDYDFFGRLAGVRGRGGKARGIPKDASELIKEFAKEDEEHSDWHSHSWNSLASFKNRLFQDKDYYKKSNLATATPIAFHNQEFNQRMGYLNLIAYAEKKVRELKADLEAEKMLLGQEINTKVMCRFVYWFDN